MFKNVCLHDMMFLVALPEIVIFIEVEEGENEKTSLTDIID